MRSALYEIFKAHSKKMLKVILTISLGFFKAFLFKVIIYYVSLFQAAGINIV